MMEKKCIEDISDKCFEMYKFRLEQISEQTLQNGKNDLEHFKDEYLSTISDYKPTGYSLSVTTEPSLHHQIFFKSGISLYIESFFDDTKEVFSQIYAHKILKFESQGGYEDMLIGLSCIK